MNICILTASPRPRGNTAALLAPVMEELERLGHTCTRFSLYDKHIEPCLACRSCQKDWSVFGCVHEDDMQEIFDAVLKCDLLLLATPVYSWYCTPPMKAALDRLVYGMNKYYGETWGPSLWEGKPVALVTTCGYPPEKAADLLEEGIRRYCKHSRLRYIGKLAARQRRYGEEFMNEELRQEAVDFAGKLDEVLKGAASAETGDKEGQYEEKN